MSEDFIQRKADVFGDLAEQDRGNVAALVARNRCATPIDIAKLFVGATLADFGKAQFDEDGDDFIGFEDGNVTHGSSDGDVLNPDELGFQFGFPVFQQHCDNVMQVGVDFIQRFALRMCAGKAGNKAHEQAGLWAPFNYR